VAIENDLGDIESLLAELKAIELWDAAYWRNRDPEIYETIAFVTRTRRRKEIIQQTVALRPSLRKRFFDDRDVPNS
jgi:hypothetical protein